VAEIAAISDAAVVGTPLPARDAGAEGAALAASEGAIAAAMFAAADDATTGAPAGDASDRKGAGDRVGAVLGAAWGAQADAAALDAERTTQVDAFTAIAGAAWEPPSHATLAAALWLSPSLRFNELYGPRQYATRSAMPPVLARMWLAWLGFAALGERLAGRALGLQELTTIWSEQAPLMHAVARWTEVPRLKPGPIELPGIDPGGFVRTLGQSFVDNKQARKPLSALVAAVVTKTSSDPVIRVAGLKSADAILRAGFA
jgi:hypothetical protein